MNILSKYKDFYDYLVGIYGVDPKLVLDRRRGTGLKFLGPASFQLAICGNLIDGFYDGEKCYVGEGLLKVGKEVEIKKFWPASVERGVKIIFRQYPVIMRDTIITLSPEIKKTNQNDKHNCPIIMVTDTSKGYEPFPKLEDYNIASIYDADTMFKMLSNWLSEKITESENIVDNRDDVAKLLDKGFDKKCSFRPKAKICT